MYVNWVVLDSNDYVDIFLIDVITHRVSTVLCIFQYHEATQSRLPLLQTRFNLTFREQQI